jgi:hypothetical protein
VGSCELCPASSNSAAASDAISDCQCAAGHAGPDGGPCVECEVGKYKQTPGSAACQACAALETTAGLASVSAAACVCAAGEGLIDGVCTTCPPGTFKPQPGDEACDVPLSARVRRAASHQQTAAASPATRGRTAGSAWSAPLARSKRRQDHKIAPSAQATQVTHRQRVTHT